MSDSAASYPVNVLGVRKAAGRKGFPARVVLLFSPRGLHCLQLRGLLVWSVEQGACDALGNLARHQSPS